MRILFLLGATSRIRNFDHTLMLLAERGHTLQLTGRPRKGRFALPDTVSHERISGAENPTQRSDEWRDFVETLRGARDYMRYLDPRYAAATRLVRRAFEIAPTGFALFCERNAWVKRHWRWVSAALAYGEDLIPVDAGFESFLRDERPDIILVTPLVTFESYQTDYVKAAHRLGIPIAFLPFSWDNLTNKGLMRVHPDRTLVWNETQAQEAIELHGCATETVVVTGAARFDDFFARRPASRREDFLAGYGLDPSRPVLLYLGSSQLTGPNEMELVRRWAESLRAAEDPVVRGCGLLVRPHPALKDSWATVDMADLGNVGISLHASRNADQELFDSLYHAHAAVGLNTSAMLEAGIVGRPVHTLVIPGFDEGQLGTMHFHYLVEAHGGLATVARDFPEHHAQLAQVLRSEPVVSERSRRFVHGFLRPRGLDQPVFEVLAGEIERVAEIRKAPRTFTPPWHYPLRWALHRWLARRWAGGGVVADATIVSTSMSLRPVKTALEELHQGTVPIFVGPWLDSVANELLYWIPFVRWAARTYGLPYERLIVISRGGARSWYGPLAGRYLDAKGLFSSSEHEHWMRRTIPQSQQNPKQAVMYPFDREIVERAARTFDVSDYQVLHPMSFFRVLRRLRADRTPARISEVLDYARSPMAAGAAAERVAEGHVAVSLAFTEALPAGPENGALLEEILGQLTPRHDVIVVDQPSRGDFGDQTKLISRAQAFVGGYGDLALLASFCGTPVFAYHSEPVPPEQLDLVRSLGVPRGWAMPSLTAASASVRLQLPSRVLA